MKQIWPGEADAPRPAFPGCRPIEGDLYRPRVRVASVAGRAARGLLL